MHFRPVEERIVGVHRVKSLQIEPRGAVGPTLQLVGERATKAFDPLGGRDAFDSVVGVVNARADDRLNREMPRPPDDVLKDVSVAEPHQTFLRQPARRCPDGDQTGNPTDHLHGYCREPGITDTPVAR